MGGPIYIRDEFLQKAVLSDEQLALWEKAKLIQPAGFTDENIPCYDEDSLLQVEHVLKLQALGYSLDELQKIVKKVGLPRSGEGKKEKADRRQFLTVGHLAERVGVSARTIKHWEDKGIIAPDMRSEGGHRLFSEQYAFLCQLIIDLQHFGYSLEEIKQVSDFFREFLLLKKDLSLYSPEDVHTRLSTMNEAIESLFKKMEQLKSGMTRWEDLLKKKKKELSTLKTQNTKRESEGSKSKG